MGFETGWAWVQAQSLYAAYTAVVIFLVWVLVKRAFIPGFLGLVGMSIIILFIQAPELLIGIGQFFGTLFGIG